MPNSQALARLRAAILEEKMTRGDARKVLTRYDEFNKKLAEFQNNQGPGPTEEEFVAWRKDICLVWAIRQLDGDQDKGSLDTLTRT